MIKQQPIYDAGNALAAAIILADPVAHGGEQALAVRWERLWKKNHETDGNETENT